MEEQEKIKLLLDMSTDIDALKLLVLALYQTLPSEHRGLEHAKKMFSDFLNASKSSSQIENDDASHSVANRGLDILSYLEAFQDDETLIHQVISKTMH